MAAEYSDDTQLKDIPGISQAQLDHLTKVEELLTVGQIRKVPPDVWDKFLSRISTNTATILSQFRPPEGIFYSILFYSILLYYILFYSILFYSKSSCSDLHSLYSPC